MLEELRITNLGVISEATIALDPGLTVVTGETGAGKTMIVTGIGLLLGGRADPRSVRTGAARAQVEGRFRVAAESSDRRLIDRVVEAGGELDDDELLVARHVTAAGRSRAYLGGAQVPAGVCVDITTDLITIHGQSEQVRLASSDRQREILDRLGGSTLAAELERYSERYGERRAAITELERLRANAHSRAREIDLLRYGLDEIDRVAPEAAEDVALAAEASRLQASDDLRLSAQEAVVALTGDDDEFGGALTPVFRARRAIDDLAARDPEASDLSRRIAEIGYLVTDLAGDLALYLDRMQVEPGRLEWIAGRRSALAGLTRKYGPTCDDVLSWAEESRERLPALESSDDRIAALTAKVSELDVELKLLADSISASRRGAADGFLTQVGPELGALALPHARLIFELTRTELGPYGGDHVDLLFSANPGSEPRSLAKVASGGELSRIRLALEVVMARGQATGTFVFDEIDAGVGGRVAVEIGRRLALLARHAQVVVVTHLAQVAAFADRHYVVVKADDGQVTTSGVVRVADDERAAELARMMAGLDTTDSALAHAGELVELAAVSRARP